MTSFPEHQGETGRGTTGQHTRSQASQKVTQKAKGLDYPGILPSHGHQGDGIETANENGQGRSVVTTVKPGNRLFHDITGNQCPNRGHVLDQGRKPTCTPSMEGIVQIPRLLPRGALAPRTALAPWTAPLCKVETVPTPNYSPGACLHT